MTAPINSAMAYHYQAAMQVRRQIQRTIQAAAGKPVRLEVPSGGMGMQRVQKSSTDAAVRKSVSTLSQASASSRSSARQAVVTHRQTKRATESVQRRTRSVSSRRSGSSSHGKRKRKALANTQADKSARDSGDTTTLSTSGIDGAGLKINRVR